MFNILKTWAIKLLLGINAKYYNIYKLPDNMYFISKRNVKRINIKFKDGELKKVKINPLTNG
jgi:hypothetical protein